MRSVGHIWVRIVEAGEQIVIQLADDALLDWREGRLRLREFLVKVLNIVGSVLERTKERLS